MSRGRPGAIILPAKPPEEDVVAPTPDGAGAAVEMGLAKGVDNDDILDMDGFTVASPSFLANEGWLFHDSDSDIPRGGAEDSTGDSSDDVAGQSAGRSIEMPSGSPASDKSPLKYLRRAAPTPNDGSGGNGADGTLDPDSLTDSIGTGGDPSPLEYADSTDEEDGRLSPPVETPLNEDADCDPETDGTAVVVDELGGGDGRIAYDDEMLSPQPRMSGELSLIYDAELNCWFDPVTHQYYVLSA
jgi:hypothetical protein